MTLLLETLLTDLPTGWQATDVYVGVNWVLSLICNPDGEQIAGIAAAPHPISPEARFQVGHHRLDMSAETLANGLRSSDITQAAVGLAAINALTQIDESRLSSADAANWLTAQSGDKSVAIFGRFPFIEDEIRPYARQLWVFEQQPQADELDSTAIETILPQADIAAITSSTVINHTIDAILPHIRRDSVVALLGPSTPLSEKLFDCGIDALFGVRVVDVAQVIAGVMAGDGFQKLQGLQRVALFERP